MMTDTLLISVAILVLGGICGAFLSSSGRQGAFWGMAVCLAGALLSIIPAVNILWTGRTISYQLGWSIPFGSFTIAADPLSALFIIIISSVCAICAVYGVGYLKAYEGYKNMGVAWCFYNLLFASMLLVVMARNGVLFIMAWEGMSLSSFFLVMFEHEKPEVRQAGWTYMIAAHFGAACLMALFVLLAGSDINLDFNRMSSPSSPFMAGVLFILAILGFGAKAGFMPLHVWLPEAHPAAPSHVSAVMSGVMIKTGIYGLLRIIPMLGPPELWWGWTLLIIGTTSGILGVLFALPQHDLKRLLAYHSIENIGIICLGLGLWLIGTATNYPLIAVLGLTGGLLHVCNHSIFKSLLFLGAGVIKHATHTLDIDRLGGLQKSMPKTALMFLIGAVSICGIPPFNGFVSEFLIYLGGYTLVSNTASSGHAIAAGVIALISLALIGGLAATCFTKVFGIIFLGAPRSESAAQAAEASPGMWFPMAILAAFCIMIGIAAPLCIRMVLPAVRSLHHFPAAELTAKVFPLLSPISLVAGILFCFIIAVTLVRRWLISRQPVVTGPTWDCGYIAPNARMQYTASSFAQPVIDMFRYILRPQRHFHMEADDFPKQIRFSTHTFDLFRTCLFEPLFRLSDTAAVWLHRLQQGRNQLYILYIAITVMALLVLTVR